MKFPKLHEVMFAKQRKYAYAVLITKSSLPMYRILSGCHIPAGPRRNNGGKSIAYFHNLISNFFQKMQVGRESTDIFTGKLYAILEQLNNQFVAETRGGRRRRSGGFANNDSGTCSA